MEIDMQVVNIIIVRILRGEVNECLLLAFNG
jgi:hypothetical protein